MTTTPEHLKWLSQVSHYTDDDEWSEKQRDTIRAMLSAARQMAGALGRGVNTNHNGLKVYIVSQELRDMALTAWREAGGE